MEDKIDKKESNNIQEQLSIALINQIIINNTSEKDELKIEINNTPKIIEKLDNFIQNNLLPKYSLLKFNKFLTFINRTRNIVNKEYNKNKIIFSNNTIIVIMSICLLRININKRNHYKIKQYLKALLIFYINGKISIDNYFYILEIILTSIIESLKNKSEKQYKLYEINKEPLLFIKDIIETIINFPIIIMNDNIFIESLINIFNKLFKTAEKLNIIIKEDLIWLKLLENNSIKESFNNNNSYNNSLKTIINFLKEIYKNNIPNKIFNEIYKTSSIDFIYYINTLTLLKELTQEEMNYMKINKGVYLLGNFYFKEGLSFSSNEFSIILSFKLIHNNTDISVLNIISKLKIIFNILIKKDNLNIEIHNDFKWNTNIKLKENTLYFICITYIKKNKSLKVYINNDKKIEELRKENVGIPKFVKDMNAIIGDVNLNFILGDIFFINKELDAKMVKQLFNMKGYYSDLIMRNNANCDLIKNMMYSNNYNELINNFKNLKYDYTSIFNSKLYLLKENNSLIEFNSINCFDYFFNTKGIEFMTFMLHNINSIITDSKLLDLYLSKKIEFILYILELLNKAEYIIEYNKENMKNKLNIFFITLFHILKSDKYYRILSDDIWHSFFKIYSLDLEYSNIYKQIILSILLDNNLFEQRNFINEINDILDKININEINDELLHKIFLVDFIFESTNIKHKKFLNLINSICSSKNKKYCIDLIRYILKVENEIKIYHYLKIIYINIKNIKSILSLDISYLYEFIEKQFKYIDHYHCKYCSYIIILCHLIKQEIIYDEDDIIKNYLSINDYEYMNNPSYLFLKAIFIENFNLKNDLKLKFIKSKSKSYFNKSIFHSLEYHPFELYDINNFLIRFKSILKYINYLMILEKNDNIIIFLDYFFNFIIDFSEKIKKRYSTNVFIYDETNKNNNEFYSSEEFTEFFISYIKFDEKVAIEKIKNFIKNQFFDYFNQFYFRLLNLKYIVIDENKSEEIKIEIINCIFDTIINYKKPEKEIRKIYYDNAFLFLILLYKNIYQNEFKKKFTRNFPSLFIKFFSFIKDKDLLFNYILINLSFFDSDNENNINCKLTCEIILDIILKFFFKGNYGEQVVKLLLINKNSKTSIFYEQDEDYLLNNEDKNNKGNNKEKYLYEIDDISFCLYFLIYFFDKYILYKEDDKNNFINKILQTIFNDLKNLYMQNKKLSSKLKRIKFKNFDIYNELLDIVNKNYKNENFSINFLQEKYSQLITQSKNENKTEINNILINENNNENKSDSNLDIKKDDLNKDINLVSRNEIIQINNKKENNISSINYLKEDIGKIDIVDIYYKLIVGDDYSKEITKILFNPKDYYIWNIFTIYFKDYIFYNKKFIKTNKAFNIHLNKFNYKDNNNIFYLNYPTKIKNYIIDEYYRPFLKPCLNFFNSEYIKISHNYIKENILKKIENKEEKINIIKYKRIIPNLNNEKYFCELIKNKGNIFGYIELNNNFFIFKNSPNDDLRSSEDPEKCLPFLFSINQEKTIDKGKYVIIYYDDIKEIIKRRVCLLYIGLEIFLKNNRSYMFNFFDKNIINKFIEEIKKINHNIYKQENQIKTEINTTNNISNNLSLNINNNNINDLGINYKLIEDPISEFKKLQLQQKNKKGELSNFDYLLLINKYSSRTYNDYNQYLIFPLLYIDKDNKIKRDLSKVISLNKENSLSDYNKAKENYETLKYHFNQHYSNSGFVLYYLVRLIPFTYQHILFQSMHFDSPARLFSSLNHIYNFVNLTEDNRELIPEFYFSFDFLLNLNHNNFGIFKKKEINILVNNVDTYCKYSIPEFIIKSRNDLEQSDLSPWIDYIFGAKQTLYSEEQPVLFNLKTYEENNELEIIKEKDIPLEKKVDEINGIVNIFQLGVTPAKMFGKLHEKMNIKDNEKENDININNKNEEKSINIINKYIQKKIKEKVDYYFINTKNNSEIELIFIFKNKIDIFKLKFGENKSTEISQKIQEIINIESYNNLLCEVLPNIYCIVRYVDNKISFFSKKKIMIYNFNCLVTSVENKNNKNIEDKTYKEIFIGDERGFLHLIEIIFDLNQKIYDIKNIKIKNSVKVHEGRINGLLYNERLNIIISWSDENDNYISINNDYDLNFINIIKIQNDICIKDILVSKYDLIYISFYEKKSKHYKIYCYTLNGIKVSSYDSVEKIVKCFIDEKINVVFNNNNGLSFYLYTFDEVFL